MIVCHCTGATDRDIRSLVRSGAKWSLPCPTGGGSPGEHCGGCALSIECIVRAEVESRNPRLPELTPAL